MLPLAVPSPTASVETLSRSEAVQLFMDRAQLQKPGFTLTEREAPAVAELVARVEGIPLALELAAARMRSLSIQEINKRLHNRFTLLTGGGRVLLERQQTLRALVAWSYDLLTDNEKLLFDRLGVFVGGFDLPAAEAVCGADPLMPEDVLDLVLSLVDKSLVMVRETDGESRYRMLETLREFGARGARQARRAGRDRDAPLRPLSRDREGGEQGAAGTRPGRMDAPSRNRARQSARRDRACARRRNGSHHRGQVRGRADGLPDPARILDRGPQVHPRGAGPARRAGVGHRHAHALYVGAVLAITQSDYAEASRMLEACLALRRRIGNPFDIAATLSTLSPVRIHAGDAKAAREGEEEALGIFRQLGDRSAEAIALLHLGEICVHIGDYREGAPVPRAVPDHRPSRRVQGDRKRLRTDAGSGRAGARRPAGRACAFRALAGSLPRTPRTSEATRWRFWWMGKVDVASGDPKSARSKLGEALRAFQSFEMNGEVVDCLEDHAELAQTLGHIDDAVRLYSAVEAFRERLRCRARRVARSAWTHAIAAARSALGDAAFDAAWSEGNAWELDQATRNALAPVAAQRLPPDRAAPSSKTKRPPPGYRGGRIETHRTSGC